MKSSGIAETGTFLLVDALPAGFEIENPVLIASGGTGNLAWLTDTTWASYTEFRDDRFVASFTNSTAKLAYMIMPWHRAPMPTPAPSSRTCTAPS